MCRRPQSRILPGVDVDLGRSLTMTRSTDNAPSRLSRILAALLALVAIAAVTAPTAAADRNRPLRTSLELQLDIFDPYLTEACGTEVTANLSGLLEKKVFVGNEDGAHGVAAHEIDTFRGEITWFAEDTGKSYSSALVNRLRIDYPEGIDLFAPARITVTGRHGGTFPIGGGPPGRGTLVYDAIIFAVDDEGFPYTFVTGDPISMSGNFERTTRRICAALA
jgi:hypothetical protein